MKKLHITILLAMFTVGALGCEPKEDPKPTKTATQTAAQEEPAPIVEKEIPDDLKAEAEREITADNAEEMAKQLEEEIAADE